MATSTLILVVSNSTFTVLAKHKEIMGAQPFQEELSRRIRAAHPDLELPNGARISIVRENSFTIMYMADGVNLDMPIPQTSLNSNPEYN